MPEAHRNGNKAITKYIDKTKSNWTIDLVKFPHEKIDFQIDLIKSSHILTARTKDKNKQRGTSLVVQWLRIRLPMQGTWIRSLVRDDPTCHGATKPVCHNYWTCALEPVSHNYWARIPQVLKPAWLEPVLHNKRSHCNEKPAWRN